MGQPFQLDRSRHLHVRTVSWRVGTFGPSLRLAQIRTFEATANASAGTTESGRTQ